MSRTRTRVTRSPTRAQIIKHDDAILFRKLRQFTHQVAANVTGTTAHEDLGRVTIDTIRVR